MQITTHERTNENGYAYETVELVGGNVVIGAHFKGQVAGLWDTLNELGLMGWEYIDDWNKHDSNYIEFQARRIGHATFDEVVTYLKNKPFSVDWKGPSKKVEMERLYAQDEQ